ncbi:MAG: ATP-dependent helicase, partial [Planctomycetia bacterium]
MTAAEPPLGPVRSLRSAELALPAARLLPAIDPRLAAPAALRLPVEVPSPTVVSVPLLIAPPAVSGFSFAPAAEPAAAPPRRPIGERRAAAPAGDAPPARKRTRILPPRDVVKLSERFFFLLQPDLETILETSRLEFPRPPFPFQFDGMAFLLPRHGAVLADEMGLGKSMQ